MKILLAILVVALVAPTPAYSGDVDHKVFKQICALLELNDPERKKLAVAFVTLEENLDAATAGVGDLDVDPVDMVDDFNKARTTFRKDVRAFLGEEQFESMMTYSSAMFYELANDIARVHVKRFEDSLKLTEDQVTALTLVVNDDLRSVVHTFLKWNEMDVDELYSDEMSNALVKIRENTRAHVKKILTEDQWAMLQQLREAEQKD